MRFTSRDLMIDVLPTAKRFTPGLVLCGQITADGQEGGGGEEDDLECGQVTATGPGGDPGVFAPTKASLALLRQQLHQTLSVQV